MTLWRVVNSPKSVSFAARHELLLVLGLLVVDQRLGGILLDLFGVAHHEEDAEDRADHQQDQPPRSGHR